MDRFGGRQGRYDDFYASNRQGRNDRSGDRSWGNYNRQDRRDDYGRGPMPQQGMGNPMMAALQAQQASNLLASLQAKNFQAQGILPTPNLGGGNRFGGNRNDGRRDNRPGNNRPGNFRPGDKRRQGQGNQGYGGKQPRRDNQQRNNQQQKNKNQARAPAKAPAAKPEPEPVIEVPDIADEDVVIPDSLMDSVEKLRMRVDVERNVADEDIGKLMVFCFTGKGYKCPICGIVLSKEAGMRHHLMGKSHVMKVIDARGNGGAKYKEVRDILDIDLASDDWYEKSEKAQAILRKQAKLIMKAEKELEIKNKMEFDKNPANFFQVESSSIKTAQKDGTTITFTHLVETSMVVKDFAGDKFFGCEFVKAESGFNCRLCNQYIRDAGNVMKHIESKNHKNSYQNFLRKNPNYEKKQKQQNGDLSEALAAEENKNVVLHETKKYSPKPFLEYVEPLLTKVPDLLVQKKEAEKEEEKTEKEDKADDEEKVDGEEKADEQDDEMEVKDEIEGEEDGAETAVAGEETANEDGNTEENADEDEKKDEGDVEGSTEDVSNEKEDVGVKETEEAVADTQEPTEGEIKPEDY